MSLILSYGRVRTQHDDFEWTIVTKMASDGLLIGSRHMVSPHGNQRSDDPVQTATHSLPDDLASSLQ